MNGDSIRFLNSGTAPFTVLGIAVILGNWALLKTSRIVIDIKW